MPELAAAVYTTKICLISLVPENTGKKPYWKCSSKQIHTVDRFFFIRLLFMPWQVTRWKRADCGFNVAWAALCS